MTTPPGNSVYADYIALQVAREEDRKASIEARGIAVVTTSGALATLLLGLVTLTKRANGKVFLPSASHGWLHAALAFFAAAALLAIVTNYPALLKYASPDGLGTLVKDSWGDDVVTSEKTVAENRIELLRSLIHANDFKGYALMAAMISEAVAVAMIAVSVWEAV